MCRQAISKFSWVISLIFESLFADDYNNALTKLRKYEHSRDSDSPAHSMVDLADHREDRNRDAEPSLAKKRRGDQLLECKVKQEMNYILRS